ncbi:hypothetical protein EJ110_NYTH05949 [Nymphaea thermarum]|nr:hypothetical protein EJ110_NYTH05949 [Nymphaea thermarum]
MGGALCWCVQRKKVGAHAAARLYPPDAVACINRAKNFWLRGIQDPNLDVSNWAWPDLSLDLGGRAPDRARPGRMPSVLKTCRPTWATAHKGLHSEDICNNSVSAVVPAPPPSGFPAPPLSEFFCAAAVGVSFRRCWGFLRRRCRSFSAPPTSDDPTPPPVAFWSFGRRGCPSFPPLAAASGSAFCLGFRVALVFQPPLVTSLCRRCVVSLLPGAVTSLLVMAEEMAPKSDVALDAGSAPKSENLPVQVTSICLTKDNYLSWSAALEIGITSRGRLPYITGDKPAPSKTDPQWATWVLEDSQVKVWIISSVSADIQPLILRKPTSFDMWTVLARMYGRKKRVLRTYQIKRSIYSLKQGDLSIASFYAALKTKWEELDYHVNDDWNCGPDHARYWEKEWMDRTFLFIGGLRDEFESIQSQILNCDEIPGIENVYAKVESEEQRRQVMHIDSSHGSGPSAFVSRSSMTGQRPVRRCSHCHKSGHSVDFCWDLHPEKRLVRGRPPSSRRDFRGWHEGHEERTATATAVGITDAATSDHKEGHPAAAGNEARRAQLVASRVYSQLRRAVPPDPSPRPTPSCLWRPRAKTFTLPTHSSTIKLPPMPSPMKKP